jgi:hypothetical protein
VTTFGNAGTRTARIDRNAVGLLGDELLVYTVNVEGAAAAFGFSCRHREILSANTLDDGHPEAEYQWGIRAR